MLTADYDLNTITTHIPADQRQPLCTSSVCNSWWFSVCINIVLPPYFKFIHCSDWFLFLVFFFDNAWELFPTCIALFLQASFRQEIQIQKIVFLQDYFFNNFLPCPLCNNSHELSVGPPDFFPCVASHPPPTTFNLFIFFFLLYENTS